MKKSSLLASTLALTLALGCLTPASNADAASKLSLSTKKVTLKVNKSKTVSANKKVTWKSSNKKIAKVKKISSKKAKITALRAGSCKITATSGKTKAVISVTVKKNKTTTTVTAAPKPTATVNPMAKPQASEAAQPLKTLTPEEKEQFENAVPEEMPGIYTANASGISLSITNCSATGIKYTLANTNNADAWFGDAYTLEKLENGSWKNVPYLDNTIEYEFTEEAYLLSAKTSNDNSINWENIYGTLDNGTYRISKEISLEPNNTNVNITCEFVINETAPASTTTPNVYTASTSGITLSVTDYSTTKIKFAIKNDNDTNIVYGENYNLQKLENGSWENVPYIIDNWAFPAIAIIVPAKTSRNDSINWEQFHGALGNGTYRIVKEFAVNGTRCNIACEFVIDETTPNQTTAPTATPVPGSATATPAVATIPPISMTTTTPATTPAAAPSFAPSATFASVTTATPVAVPAN